MQRLFLTSCIFFLSFYYAAAQTETDSASTLVITKLHLKDTTSIFTNLDFAKKYMHTEYEKALYYGSKALQTAAQLEHKRGQLESVKILGKICNNMGKYELALDYQHQALQGYETDTIYKKGKDIRINEKGSIEPLHDLAAIYMNMGEYEAAMEYKNMALALEEKYGDEDALAKSYDEIAFLYAKVGTNERALNFCSKSISLREKMGNKLGLANSYKTLGLVYSQMSTASQALEYLRKASEIYKATNQNIALSDVMNLTGDVYFKEKNYIEADTYYKQARFIKSQIGDKKGETYTLLNIGKNQMEMKAYPLATESFKQALALAKKLDYEEYIKECYLKLSNVSEASGYASTALAYYKLYDEFQRKTIEEVTQKKIAEIHDVIETSRKQRELMVLTKEQKIHQLEKQQAEAKQNNYLMLIAFSMFLVFAAGFGIVKIREANKQLEKQNAIIHQKTLALEELDRTKNRFFSIIAHDLKGPLNSLTGFSALVINHIEFLSKDEIKMIAENLDKSVKNLTEFLNNLLTWSRSQMDNIQFEPKKLLMANLVNEIIDLHQIAADNKNIQLVSTITVDTQIYADENAVKTILRNLVSNALKFTKEGGKVTLAAKAQDDKYIQLTITDTGVGMPEEVVEKIFRIDTKHSTQGTKGETGTGLGLVLCKEFAEKNGGSISVESIVDLGTTFKVILPKG
jgi:signal transduction histidine kinase